MSNDPTLSGTPLVATSGNNVYVVWENNTAGNEDILFCRNTNNGGPGSWDPVIKLSNTPNGDATNPQIAAVGSNVYVVWQANVTLNQNDVFFRASPDNGLNFGGVIDFCHINNNDNTACGTVKGVTDSEVPSIAASGNGVTVVWLATTTSGPNLVYNILAKSSSTNGSDLGSTSAATLSTNAYSATATLAPPQVASVGNFAYATWSDVRNGASFAQTFFSSNSGSGWVLPAFNITKQRLGETDFNQAIAATGNNVYVVWTNETFSCSNSCDNTMFSSSTSNGAQGSFSTSKNLYPGEITDLSPHVAASGNNVYVAWSNNTMAGQVLFRASGNKGTGFNNTIVLTNSLTPASCNLPGCAQFAMAAAGSNVFLTWAQGSTSHNVSLVLSSNNGISFGLAQVLNPGALNTLNPTPAIAASGSNAYVAWQDSTPGNDDIFFRVSSNLVRDIAVTGMTIFRAFVYQGVSVNPIKVNVTLGNHGSVSETFNVTAKAGSTVIFVQLVTMVPGNVTIIHYNWNTNTLAVGSYQLSAQVPLLPGETVTSDNSYTDGTLQVRKVGDVDGNGVVNLDDVLLVAISWGGSYSANADIDNNGIVNLDDVLLVTTNWH